MKIPLIKPYMSADIVDRVVTVLNSGYLTEGPVTKELEKSMQHFLQCNHALAVTSATTGLEIALRALNIGAGDEVIVPDFTYPATASVASIVGAKVVIVDVEKETMNIDYQAIENAITDKTKAIIPVSLFGNPLDYQKLNSLKEKHNLYIVEDAACSIGAQTNGQMVGSQADITVFSMHPRKFITTGEGGMVTTQNKEWADWMNSYKHFGMDMSNTNREGIHFDIMGTNYKLSNIQAAIGLGQMQIVDDLLSKRIALAENYNELLKDPSGKIKLPKLIDNSVHSYQTYCVFIENRNEVMKAMREKGIEVQIGTYSLHKHKAFQDESLVRIQGDMTGSQWCCEHALALPLYHELSMENQETVVNELKNCIK